MPPLALVSGHVSVKIGVAATGGFCQERTLDMFAQLEGN